MQEDAGQSGPEFPEVPTIPAPGVPGEPDSSFRFQVDAEPQSQQQSRVSAPQSPFAPLRPAPISPTRAMHSTQSMQRDGSPLSGSPPAHTTLGLAPGGTGVSGASTGLSGNTIGGIAVSAGVGGDADASDQGKGVQGVQRMISTGLRKGGTLGPARPSWPTFEGLLDASLEYYGLLSSPEAKRMSTLYGF